MKIKILSIFGIKKIQNGLFARYFIGWIWNEFTYTVHFQRHITKQWLKLSGFGIWVKSRRFASVWLVDWFEDVSNQLEMDRTWKMLLLWITLFWSFKWTNSWLNCCFISIQNKMPTSKSLSASLFFIRLSLISASVNFVGVKSIEESWKDSTFLEHKLIWNKCNIYVNKLEIGLI